MNTDEMKIFLDDRKKALLSMDRKVIEQYAKKYEINLPKDEEVFWCSIHKARTADKNLPIYQRRKSEQWLIERGYQSFSCSEE